MAGRKSLRDEVVQANVINLSWLTISRALHSGKITEDEKRMIALEVVKKTCPREINIKGDALVRNTYIIIEQLQREFQENCRPSLALDSGDGLHAG